MIVVSSTSTRLLNDYRLTPLLEEEERFSKNEVLEKLKYNKMFLRSFRKGFCGDSFWECLDTKPL